MQAAIYRNHAYPDAQYQIAIMEVAAMHVLDGQFKQRHILGVHGQVDRGGAKDRLENGPCHS